MGGASPRIEAPVQAPELWGAQPAGFGGLQGLIQPIGAVPVSQLTSIAAAVSSVEEQESPGLFRAALADAVKGMLKLPYQGGLVDKESFKTITRKSVDKLISAHEVQLMCVLWLRCAARGEGY